ncbi:MAG: hypothetical protein GX455_17050 [Phycisphaerae bacterium]|nr:hypothetical protein [Phycisphaerae bacterium]
MKSFKLALVLCMVVAATTVAAPLNKATVSGKAEWVLHADTEAFLKTKLGQAIRAELAAQGIEQKLAEFKTFFSFHPLDDIRNITIYGVGKEPTQAVVLAQGNFDQAKLDSMVRMNSTFKSADYGKYSIDSWIDENKPGSERIYGVWHGTDRLLLSQGEDAVKTALDVLDGKADSAVGKTLIGEPVKGAFLTITAEKVGEIVKGDQNAAVFQQAERLTLALGEKEGRCFITGALATKSADEATTINQALQGMLAFVKLATQDKLPKVTALANAMKIVAENASVGLHFEWDSADLIAILKNAGEIKAQLDAAGQPQPKPAQ